MIIEYLFKKALDAAYEAGRKILKESGSKLISSPTDSDESIRYHLRSVESWSAEVSFNDIKKAKRTTDIFIELDLYVQPRRMRIFSDERVESIPLRDIFATKGHFVLLGQPGAGKTTSMKHFCQLLLHDDTFHVNKFFFPLLRAYL